MHPNTTNVMDSSSNTKFAPVFKDEKGEYLFVRNLGQGVQATAQLVLHLESGECHVRKVFKNPGTLQQIIALGAHVSEARILTLLQAAAQATNSNDTHIVTVFGSSYAEVPSTGSAQLVVPVLCIGFCNGGDLSGLQDAPESIVFRMVLHVAQALKFMYANSVMHNDLHSGNVLVNLTGDEGIDFYVGDFGHATSRSETEAAEKWFGFDAFFLIDLIHEVREERVSREMQDILRELSDLADNVDGGVGFPNLDRLLALAEHAAEDDPVTAEDLECFRKPAPLRIAHYDDVDTCLQNLDEGFDPEVGTIEGPFQIATVSVDSTGGVQSIVSIDEEIRYFAPSLLRTSQRHQKEEALRDASE